MRRPLFEWVSVFCIRKELERHQEVSISDWRIVIYDTWNLIRFVNIFKFLRCRGGVRAAPDYRIPFKIGQLVLVDVIRFVLETSKHNIRFKFDQFYIINLLSKSLLSFTLNELRKICIKLSFVWAKLIKIKVKLSLQFKTHKFWPRISLDNCLILLSSNWMKLSFAQIMFCFAQI